MTPAVPAPPPDGHSAPAAGVLAVGEATLGLAIEAAEIGTWDLDLLTDTLTWPARTKAMFGISPDAPASMSDFYAGLHPVDREATAAAFAAALDPAVRSVYDVEYRTIGREDGVIRWVAAKGRGLFDAEGRCVRAVGTAIDVTARKSAEARGRALLDLADRLRNLDDTAAISRVAGEVLGRGLEVARAGYGTIDPLAETITIEDDWRAPGVASLAGVLHFRDYGSYIEDLKHGEAVAIVDARGDARTAAAAPALEAISARAFVNMPVTEAGGFVALLFANHDAPRVWTDDELAFMREIAERTRAVIERRRAEAALRALNATLEARVAERTAERDRVWRNSRDLLVVIGGDGVFRAINPAWTTILGHAPEEVVGRRFTDFLCPEDEDLTQSALETAVAQNDLDDLQNRYRHKDGTLRWISWRTTTEGDLVYAYGRDVTAEREQAEALKRTEAELRQAQKMEAVGQLTGGVAHDFNNLLTGITGGLELLQARIAQGRTDDLDRFLQAAQGAARRAAALTQRLLAFSRRQTLDPRPTDLNRLIAGMEELIRRTVGPGVEVEVVQAGGLWATLIDPHQLDNALLNLCVNGRDAMPDGGRLTIETANKWLDARAGAERDLPPGQYVSLCVTDTGTGMTPEVAGRAFEPFFTTKPLGAGTGLGLSMIYGFVRQSGGQVRIYSEAGKGTTMCLYLPRHHAGVAAVEPVGGEADPPACAVGTVLVVDDEPTVRMLVAEILAEGGHRTIEAPDGPTGLKILQTDVVVDLLITDVGLPGGLNGRQVADGARELRPDLKVLFITGYAENAAVGNGHLEPGMELLTKPFTMDDLRRKIADLLR